MTNHWPTLPLREGDVVWFDDTEVEITGREDGDVFAVIVDGDETVWHIDQFDEAGHSATRIEVDSRDVRGEP